MSSILENNFSSTRGSMNPSIQPGDIILVHSGSSFIARGITLFMKRYIRKHNYTCKPYHHAATVIQDGERIMIAEANQDGYEIHTPSEAYSNYDWQNRIDVFRPVIGYTGYEKQLISNHAKKYSFEVTRYDFMNFIWWVYYFITGLWIGKNNDRLYCSEAAAELANRVRIGTFVNPQRTNPVDIAVNGNYRLLTT